jgi:hypothetical protein
MSCKHAERISLMMQLLGLVICDGTNKVDVFQLRAEKDEVSETLFSSVFSRVQNDGQSA